MSPFYSYLFVVQSLVLGLNLTKNAETTLKSTFLPKQSSILGQNYLYLDFSHQ